MTSLCVCGFLCGQEPFSRAGGSLRCPFWEICAQFPVGLFSFACLASVSFGVTSWCCVYHVCGAMLYRVGGYGQRIVPYSRRYWAHVYYVNIALERRVFVHILSTGLLLLDTLFCCN
ncbi:uncharacterized protein CYBJADRAFT_92461 [Cyberlindnera jadinii NRRL Y-1542]|uniref:Uncharacterized protein n=1 Tax=Cyberlindnera jadinii (strain ATCC 18201 / CBS 1600 / BCRC 20928 / JCM 3617 / NBRC 0987 / NRRL Y-1542) TaxID=983966 RepID=A0A1E4S1K6_CYBJN|nr:hypothetical protein CYBJADRAFT_92461 [Cyberlindnera jadinii NRRL Y-1542]ODV73352.1 hypothetical protein CYBJADRAFT_92461 [Cyberlindnera jadinii NRRL Y-1542]